MTALAVVAFLAGRWSGAPGTVAPATSPAAATTTVSAPDAGDGAERILLVAAGDHFDRTQMVLAELVNADPSQAGDSRRRAGPCRRPGVDQPGDPAVGGSGR